MSEVEEKDERIAELQRELRGTQEMLFLVLQQVGEPVTVPGAVVKGGITGDHIIDATLDTEADVWTFKVVKVEENAEQ